MGSIEGFTVELRPAVAVEKYFRAKYVGRIPVE